PAARDDEIGPWQGFGAGVFLERRGIALGGGPVPGPQRGVDRSLVEEEVVVADRAGGEQRLAFGERRPALLRVVGVKREPAEQPRSEIGHARLPADRERVAEQARGAAPAPAARLDQGEKAEPFRLETARPEL